MVRSNLQNISQKLEQKHNEQLHTEEYSNN